MAANHINQSLFVARNAISMFLTPPKTSGISSGSLAETLNNIAPDSGYITPDFRGSIQDNRRYVAYAVGSFGAGQNNNDFGNYVYSGNTGLIYRFTDAFALGGGIVASEDHQDTYRGGNSQITAKGGSIVASYEYERGWRAYGGLTYVDIDVDNKRGYLNGTRQDFSKAKTDGNAYGGIARLGYAFYPNIYGRISFMPYGELEYSKTNIDAYKESGGAFPADVKSQKSDTLISRFGAQTSVYVNDELTMRAKAAWGHRYTDGSHTQISVANMSFSLPNDNGDPNWAEAGLTGLYSLSDRTLLSGDVTSRLGRNAEPAVNFTLGLTYRF